MISDFDHWFIFHFAIFSSILDHSHPSSVLSRILPLEAPNLIHTSASPIQSLPKHVGCLFQTSTSQSRTAVLHRQSSRVHHISSFCRRKKRRTTCAPAPSLPEQLSQLPRTPEAAALYASSPYCLFFLFRYLSCNADNHPSMLSMFRIPESSWFWFPFFLLSDLQCHLRSPASSAASPPHPSEVHRPLLLPLLSRILCQGIMHRCHQGIMPHLQSCLSQRSTILTFPRQFPLHFPCISFLLSILFDAFTEWLNALLP